MRTLRDVARRSTRTRGRSAAAAASPATSAPSAREAGEAAGALDVLIADAIARRAYGTPMTPWELPAVVACRDAIADAIRQLPIVAMRSRRPRPDQPTVYRRPDPDEPRGRTLERIAYQLTGPGYCWLWIVARDAAGQPLVVRLLDADQAAPSITDAYGRTLEVTTLTGDHLTLGRDVVRVANKTRAAGDLGLSPIGQCWRAVEYLCALYDMAGSFWEAGFPSLAVTVEQRLSAAQSEALKQQVLSAWARKHEPAVIDAGGRLESVGSSAVESQLVESIGTANQEIARAHGCPPSIINAESGGSLTYTTAADEKRGWLQLGLGGYLNRIEEAFSDLAAYGTEARLDTDEWLRADPQARAELYATATGGAAWLTVDEVRDREGLEPLDASSSTPATPTAATAATPTSKPPAIPTSTP